MKVCLNGEAVEVAEQTSLQELISRLALGDRRFAVEVNEEVIPRSVHETHALQPGDRVEVVHAIGGG